MTPQDEIYLTLPSLQDGQVLDPGITFNLTRKQCKLLRPHLESTGGLYLDLRIRKGILFKSSLEIVRFPSQ